MKITANTASKIKNGPWAFVGTQDVTRRGDVVVGGTIGLAFGAWWLD